MLGTIIIIAAVVLGLIMAFFLRRQHPPRWLTLIGLIGLIGGGALTLYGSSEISADMRRLHTWPVISGVVVSSRIVGERAFHVALVYQYTVDGVEYVDSAVVRQPSFGNKDKRLDVAEVNEARYPAGAKIQLRYDPENPKESTIEDSVFWAEYGQTGFGAFVMALGVGLVTMGIRKRRPGDGAASNETETKEVVS
jgi:hypothetical protein